MKEPKLTLGVDLVNLIINALRTTARLTITELVEIIGANRNTLKIRLELAAVGRA